MALGLHLQALSIARHQIRLNNLCLRPRELGSFLGGVGEVGGVGSDTKKHGMAALASCLNTCWKSLRTLRWWFMLYKFKICITNKFVPICSLLFLVKFYLKDNCWTCHIDTIWSQHYDVITTLFWIIKVCRWSGPRPRYFGVYSRAAEYSPNKARQLRESHVQVWHLLWEWKSFIFMCPLG